MAINILRSERPLLCSLLALPFSNLCLLIMLDHCKTRLIIIIIKFLIILLMAWLKNTIIAITLRTVRLWTKAMPRTATTETTTAAIRIITTLGTATAAIVIKVIRPIGV